MTEMFSLTGRYVANAVRAAKSVGIDAESLCRVAGIYPTSLLDDDVRVPVSNYERLLSEVVRLTRNEFFWLQHAGPLALPKNHLVRQVMFSAKNIRDMYSSSDMLFRLYSNIHFLVYHETDDEFSIRLCYRDADFQMCAYEMDRLFSGCWHLVQKFSGSSLELMRIQLLPEYANRQFAYQQYFKTTVVLDHGHNELVFKRELSLAPSHREADPNLSAMLVKMVETKLQTQAHHSDFILGLRTTIYQLLPDGGSDIKTVAEQMGTSSRTLQRKLKEHSSSFSEQLEQVRKELLPFFLSQKNYSLSEVGKKLGYMNTASLHKACQTWFGVSPGEYRRNHLSNTPFDEALSATL